QNLRDFTVQIRRIADDRIVGTGIAVSMDGQIATCAHVVKAAGVDPYQADGSDIGIYFPQVRESDAKRRQARVERCFDQKYDDDVVLLRLTGGQSPLAPEQIAVLGKARDSEGKPFRAYGYSPLATYAASRADGKIMGTVEPPIDKTLQTDPVQLE